jgi:hypothetical protein
VGLLGGDGTVTTLHHPKRDPLRPCRSRLSACGDLRAIRHIDRGPCAPPQDIDADDPLTVEEAEQRAAQFSALMGCEVTAPDVMAADADWLERYGRRIDDVYDGYFPEDTL